MGTAACLDPWAVGQAPRPPRQSASPDPGAYHDKLPRRRMPTPCQGEFSPVGQPRLVGAAFSQCARLGSDDACLARRWAVTAAAAAAAEAAKIPKDDRPPSIWQSLLGA